ncbi:DUF502 domain-containing protein [Acinetobacter baumannii]
MLKKSFNSLLTTWLAGLLVMLPLVLTLALLAWVVSLLHRFVGPSSLIGRGFAAIGQPLAGDSPLAYLLGTALLLVAIYLLGLGVQLGLKRPLANLFDLTLRRTPLIGNLYNLADRFVGLLDKKQDADIAAMSPVWCFFGGDGAAFNRPVLRVGLKDTSFQDLRFTIAGANKARGTDPGLVQTNLVSARIDGTLKLQGNVNIFTVAPR